MKQQANQLSKNNPYYLPKHRNLELRHFALQYPEWKQELADISWIRPRSEISSTNVADPTYSTVASMDEYQRRIDLIEECAKLADPYLWTYILKGVTTEITYENLRLRYNIPCCRVVYYTLYRKFFWILDKHRK